MGALGRPGGPRDHFLIDLAPFLMDFRWIVGGCGRLSFVYPGCIFLSCAIILYDTFRSPLSLQVPESVSQTLEDFLREFVLTTVILAPGACRTQGMTCFG